MAREIWKQKLLWRRFLWRKAATFNRFDPMFFAEDHFHQKLMQERRRAERSNKPLLVMIINAGYLGEIDESDLVTGKLGQQIPACIRDTDICGLLKDGTMIGVILTEVEAEKIGNAKRIVAKKIREKLNALLKEEVARRVTISFRIYPEIGGRSGAFDMIFYPEIRSGTFRKLGGQTIKRAIDILGSVAGLILFLPAFIVLPLFIKIDSDGPVFFSQERVGLNGRRFKLLKLRTMFVENDDVIHREFVRRLIEGKMSEERTNTVFKITGDPRITALGQSLRKYSLDELPQLLNVLKGDMSLVGPRPPIAYELEHYSGWQRNRLIGKKPGITGSWQVSGRSSTSFDEMVRLDLRYLKGWSIRLDIKIILKTPLAVLRCRGAY